MLDPTLGRWTKQDPLGYHDGPNLYEAVHSNPAIARDPTGLTTIYQDPVIYDGPDTAEGTPCCDGDRGGRLGGTENKFEVRCSCVQQDADDPNSYIVRCTVTLRVFIVIDKTDAGEKKKPLPGIYGHEQCHVQNLINSAKITANDLRDQLE